MQSKNRYRGIDSYALSCVRYYARRLIEKHPLFQEQDFEDIEQELVLYFLQESGKFNPAKSSWELHISMILKKRVVWLIVQTEAKKRGGRVRPLSFAQFRANSPTHVALEDVIPGAAGLWGDPFAASTPENLDLRADVETFLGQLPPHLRQLAEWLKERNPTDIAKETGIPRSTLNSRIGKLRECLKEAGIENYFEESSPLFLRPVKPRKQEGEI